MAKSGLMRDGAFVGENFFVAATEFVETKPSAYCVSAIVRIEFRRLPISIDRIVVLSERKARRADIDVSFRPFGTKFSALVSKLLTRRRVCRASRSKNPPDTTLRRNSGSISTAFSKNATARA